MLVFVFHSEMASGKSVSSALEIISRHHLECSICHERYEDPKILDCVHSFCERCLQKYCSTRHQGSTEIPCPVCRRETRLPETGVQGLRTNFYLIALIEEFALHEKLACSDGEKLLCEICDEGNEATHRCLDCAQTICLNCHKVHLRFAATSNHTISTLDDIREGKVQPSKKLERHPKCPNHDGEVTRFFCTTCEMLICRDCTVVLHPKPQHVYIDRHQATSTYKQSLTELCSQLENTLKEIKEFQATVSRMKHELDATVNGIMAEVQSKADEMRAEVTRQENRIIEDIKMIHKDRNEKLVGYEKTLNVMLERIQHSLETTRDVTSTASDSDFLSLYPIISQDLKLLSSQTTPEVDPRLAYLKFEQSEGVGDISLGKLVTGKWELFREFDLQGSYPGEFCGAWGIAARRPDEIAVADSWNNQLVICSIDGKYRSAISTSTCK